MKKRALGLLLVVCMLVAMLPIQVLAVDTTGYFAKVDLAVSAWTPTVTVTTGDDHTDNNVYYVIMTKAMWDTQPAKTNGAAYDVNVIDGNDTLSLGDGNYCGGQLAMGKDNAAGAGPLALTNGKAFGAAGKVAGNYVLVLWSDNMQTPDEDSVFSKEFTLDADGNLAKDPAKAVVDATAKTYDGNNQGITVTSLKKGEDGSGDDVTGYTVEYKVKGAADNTYTTTVPTDAATYTYRITHADYSIVNGTGDFTINKAALTITGTPTKAYDGNTTVKADGLTAATGLTVDASAVSYANKNVGAAVAISGTWKVTGTTAANYTVTGPTSGAITAKAAAIAAKTTDITADVSALNDPATYVTTSDLVTGETLADVYTLADGTNTVADGTAMVVSFFSDDTATTPIAKPTAAGEYYVKVTFTDGVKGNYKVTGTNSADAVKLTVTAPSTGDNSAYTVTYLPGEHGKFADDEATTELVAAGKAPAKAPKVEPETGFEFLGWSLDGKTVVDLSKQQITRHTTLIAVYSDGHKHYMVGTSAGIFSPNGSLTRAEAATMLSRLSEGFSEDGAYTTTKFSDLPTTEWYFKYVSFAAEKAIVTGYNDGTYRPTNTVSRQEFMVMIARFLGLSAVDTAPTFKDADKIDSWATGLVAALEKAGVVEGNNGMIRPLDEITRAEAATMINRALNRVPKTALDLAANGYTNPFTDVKTADWFFAHVMEATIDHPVAHFHDAK